MSTHRHAAADSSVRPSGVVLAGGDGQRLRAFTRERLGDARPKQYCAFTGTRSMLDHTLDRAAGICARDRTVTIVARSHRKFLARRPARRTDGRFVYQPANRDTAAGILLGLSYVLDEAPEAPVIVFPSDHFISPEWRFLDAVRAAAAATRVLSDHVILMGAPPDGLELDYGWITRGRSMFRVAGRPFFQVESFLEKPGRAAAEAARQAGGLWNTFILVARARTLWDISRQPLADLVPYFEHLRAVVGTEDEQDVLDEVYRMLPARSFSRDVLEHVPDRTLVMEMPGVTWSDWGRPERILETLEGGFRPTTASLADPTAAPAFAARG